MAVSCVGVAFLLPETKGLIQEEIAAATAAHPVWGPLTGTAAAAWHAGREGKAEGKVVEV